VRSGSAIGENRLLPLPLLSQHIERTARAIILEIDYSRSSI